MNNGLIEWGLDDASETKYLLNKLYYALVKARRKYKDVTTIGELAEKNIDFFYLLIELRENQDFKRLNTSLEDSSGIGDVLERLGGVSELMSETSLTVQEIIQLEAPSQELLLYQFYAVLNQYFDPSSPMTISELAREHEEFARLLLAINESPYFPDLGFSKIGDKTVSDVGAWDMTRYIDPRTGQMYVEK